MADKRLRGKVALVTGAGQGIGRGVALALAEQGASVGVLGRTTPKVDAVAGEITEAGGTALALTADVSVKSEVENAVSAVVDAFTQLDILVNCAQALNARSVAETTLDDVQLAFSTGALGTLFSMQAAYPSLMVAGGSIVNFGSYTGIRGEAAYGAYAMAKEAIRALTRVAANEWAAHNIRVNTICPTALTPPTQAYFDSAPEAEKEFVGAIPLGRLGDPQQDIGRAVVALVSDDLSYLTGATLMLDGGLALL